jgi:biotin-(acetyl-CoA carboxylase) ligase
MGDLGFKKKKKQGEDWRFSLGEEDLEGRGKWGNSWWGPL